MRYIKKQQKQKLHILHGMLIILQNEIETGMPSRPEDYLKFITRAIEILQQIETNQY